MICIHTDIIFGLNLNSEFIINLTEHYCLISFLKFFIFLEKDLTNNADNQFDSIEMIIRSQYNKSAQYSYSFLFLLLLRRLEEI
jgi:hypothetical protein